MNGFQLEKILVEELNEKNIENLNQNLKKLIFTVYNQNFDSLTLIKANTLPPGSKPDIEIKINDNSKYLSLKKGSGNSIHQEPLEDFISHLDSIIDLPPEIADDLRFFIWGDGSIDGSGVNINGINLGIRYSASQLVKLHSDVVNRLRQFFSPGDHLGKLIERFSLMGTSHLESADFIVHTNENYVNSCSIIDGKKFVLKANSNEYNNHFQDYRQALPFGIALSLQAWNRNITYKPDKEIRRGHIQLKITKIGEKIINDE
jgi:hypothetical protein